MSHRDIVRSVIAHVAMVMMCLAGMWPTSVGAQRSTPARPFFDVASVHANTSDTDLSKATFDPGGGVTLVNLPLLAIVERAYGVRRLRIAAYPPWIESARFDIVAKPAAGRPAQGDSLEMLRALLEDRFALRVRREIREQPVYFLEKATATLGAGAKPSVMDCAAVVDARKKYLVSNDAPPPSKIYGRDCGLGFRIGRGTVTLLLGGETMTALANALAQRVGRVVLDRTEIEGRFDIDLLFSPDEPLPPILRTGENPLDLPPPLRTALREQLGLRLTAGRAPIEMLIVDSASRPSEN